MNVGMVRLKSICFLPVPLVPGSIFLFFFFPFVLDYLNIFGDYIRAFISASKKKISCLVIHNLSNIRNAAIITILMAFPANSSIGIYFGLVLID